MTKWDLLQERKNGSVLTDQSVCYTMLGLPGASDDKESAYNVGDPGSVPESGGHPAEGTGCPLQCSRLEKPMHRAAWRLQALGPQRVRHNWATNTHA